MTRYRRYYLFIAFLTYLFIGPLVFEIQLQQVLAQAQLQSGLQLPLKVPGGTQQSGQINIPSPVPEGGLPFSLESNPKLVELASPNIINKDEKSPYSFLFKTQAVSNPQKVRVTVTVGDKKSEADLTIHPLLTVTPSEVVGGEEAVAKIEFPVGKDKAAVDFTFKTDSQFVKFEPAQVKIQPNQDEATVKIKTDPVAGNSTAKITVEGANITEQSVEITLAYNLGRLLAAITVGVVTVLLSFFVFPIILDWFKSKKPSAHPLKELTDGDDGLPSTSIFQYYLWTAVVIFGYSSLVFIKLWSRTGNNLKIERNILIVMGVSAATLVLAKAVEAKKAREGRTVKFSPLQAKSYLNERGERGLARFRYIFTDDAGNPHLTKIQVLAWTFIAVGIFLFDWYNTVIFKRVEAMQLPVIDDALVVLMGLANGAYLGNKFVKIEGPILIKPDPPNPKPGDIFAISGVGFTLNEGSVVASKIAEKRKAPAASTSKQGGTVAYYKPVNWVVKEWKEELIKAEVPKEAKAGEEYMIEVIANNQPSLNAVKITIS